MLNSPLVHHDTFQPSAPNGFTLGVAAFKAELNFCNIGRQLPRCVNGPVKLEMRGEETPHHSHDILWAEKETLTGTVCRSRFEERLYGVEVGLVGESEVALG